MEKRTKIIRISVCVLVAVLSFTGIGLALHSDLAAKKLSLQVTVQMAVNQLGQTANDQTISGQTTGSSKESDAAKNGQATVSEQVLTHLGQSTSSGTSSEQTMSAGRTEAKQATGSNKAGANNDQRAATSAADNEWLWYEPTIVELSGVIRDENGWGPPNYGEDPETDEKVVYPVLVLDKPVNVRPHEDDDTGFNQVYENVNKMQLVILQDNLWDDVHQNLNKRVKMQGTLFGKQTGHHYTDVLIMVEGITSIE